MKHKHCALLIAVIMIIATVIPSLGANGQLYDRTAPIPYVNIRINTGDLNAGDALADASAYVVIEENQYYLFNGADWLDSVSSLKVGDEPRMKVYLSAIPRQTVYESYVKSWYFTGSYSASNVHITGGEYISSGIRDAGQTLEVQIRVKPVKGNYDMPLSAEWDAGTLGKAKWEASSNDSGVYDVYCYRNEVCVKKLEKYTGNFYNFYPYMTKPGDYTFKVRTTVPNGKENTGANKSDYMNSGPLVISDSNKSSGAGQTTSDELNGSAGISGGNVNYPNGTGNENVAGWVTDNTGTYFRYPSGVIAKNCWIELNGNFYLVDANGKRLTGWQLNPSKTNWFYMDPTSGIMKTGWFRDGQYWYYLEPEGSAKGMRISGWRDINGKRYYFNNEGIMVTGWFEIDGKWYYFYPEGSRTDGAYGFMAANTRIGDFNIGADGTWLK